MSRENVEIMRVDARAGWVAHFRDGLVTTFQTYANRAEALEAVGLTD